MAIHTHIYIYIYIRGKKKCVNFCCVNCFAHIWQGRSMGPCRLVAGNGASGGGGAVGAHVPGFMFCNSLFRQMSAAANCSSIWRGGRGAGAGGAKGEQGRSKEEAREGEGIFSWAARSVRPTSRLARPARPGWPALPAGQAIAAQAGPAGPARPDLTLPPHSHTHFSRAVAHRKVYTTSKNKTDCFSTKIVV